MAGAAVATLAKGEQQTLRDEILALLRGRCLEMIPDGTPKHSVFARGTVAHRLGMSVTVEEVSARSSGYCILVRLLQDAAGDSLVQPILDKLDDKRRTARAQDYDRSNPLWLVLEVTEQTGAFADSIITVGADATRPIDPFERVVVHDGRTWSVLEAASA